MENVLSNRIHLKLHSSYKSVSDIIVQENKKNTLHLTNFPDTGFEHNTHLIRMSVITVIAGLKILV